MVCLQRQATGQGYCKIIGCAMKMHNTLGNGFQEVIYQRCLAIELRKIAREFAREQEQIIYYKGEEVSTRRSDFIVEGNIMVEIKALINLEDVHLAQAKNNVVAYDLPVGLLINFGAASLPYKKVFNSKHNSQQKNPLIPKILIQTICNRLNLIQTT